MADRLRLEVVTPSRVVFEGDVATVQLPGSLGELGVLPGHTPLLTSLATGPLRFVGADGARAMAVQGGFAEVMPDRVTVLARLAEWPADIDAAAARRDREEANTALKDASAEAVDELAARVRLAETRLEVAEK